MNQYRVAWRTVYEEDVFGPAGSQVVAGFTAVRPVVRLVERGDGQLAALHDHTLHVRELPAILGPQHRFWTKRRRRRSNDTKINKVKSIKK